MILSVSRRTDIPNYYSDWFYRRISEGFLYVRNPLNARQISRISLTPEVVDCIVFWTKNPQPMMERFHELDQYKCLFHFTLNAYGKEIEPGVPDCSSRITTFQNLAQRIGSRQMLWRYDPIFFTDLYTPEFHIRMFRQLAEELRGSTVRVYISFMDWYAAAKRRMKHLSVVHHDEKILRLLARELWVIAAENGMTIVSCAEPLSLEAEGIAHGACFDPEVIQSAVGCPMSMRRSNVQRPACGCVDFVETGTYDTCRNNCLYCYANRSNSGGLGSLQSYDRDSPLLCGKVGEDDKITERKVKSWKQEQIALF